MSTIKSSAENLTLNADGSGNDVIIQSNAATKAIVTAEGNVGVGTNTPLMASTAYNGLHVNATYPTVKLSANATGHAATDGFHLRIDSTPRVEYWNYENSDQVFANNNGVKLRLLAAGGLCFGTDTAAANALDDYEEGTWTIVMTGSSSGSGNVGTGHYTKIGRMVHCIVIIDNATTPTFSGNMLFSLPFTGSSGNGNRNENSGDVYFYPLSKWTTGSDFTGVVAQVYGNNPTTGYFQLKRTNTNRQSQVNSSQGSNSAQSGVYARFSITYTAA